jgi:hypothetical protein
VSPWRQGDPCQYRCTPAKVAIVLDPLSRRQPSRDDAIEDWSWLDQNVPRSSRSRQVCMTCHFFPPPPGPQLHPAAHLPPAPGADRPWRAPHPSLQRPERGPAPPSGLGACGGVRARASNRPPLSPKEAWLSDGRQVLHFRPSRWDRWSQQLEVTVGELLPDQPVPLLKSRLDLSREWDPPQMPATG